MKKKSFLKIVAVFVLVTVISVSTCIFADVGNIIDTIVDHHLVVHILVVLLAIRDLRTQEVITQVPVVKEEVQYGD